MQIAIACDSAAYDLKTKVIKRLENIGFSVVDFGSDGKDSSVDYPDFAFKACLSVANGECEKAVLICGTGIGMSICANKMKGIRCALCSDTFSAKMTRLHNDANVLAFGARVVGEGLAMEIVDAFFGSEFSGEERHKRRIDKILKIESGESL